MNNKTLLIWGMGFSTASLAFFPPIFGLLAFVISIMLLCRRSDGPGLYLFIFSIIYGVTGVLFGSEMMVKESIIAMLIAAILNAVILVCMEPLKD